MHLQKVYGGSMPSTELRGLARVAKAIREQISGEATPAPPGPKATPSQLSEFEVQLRRVLDKAPRAQQSELDRLWRRSFDSDPGTALSMLKGVR